MIPASVELLPDEEFRPVVGWPSYCVSNRGRIYSLPKGNWRGGFMTPQTPGAKKYVFVLLRDRDRRKTSKVHRLVAEAFITGPRKQGIIRHLNGDGLDNRVENLAWGTASENSLDMVRHGTHPSSSKTHCPQGHPYDTENTCQLIGRLPQRKCRTCIRLRARERRALFGQRPLKPASGPPAREIRAWAKAQGLPCAGKGPVPLDVRAAYVSSHELAAAS